MPKFSVLIPTHNREDLLKYAIQSVLVQDYKDFEIIVSDNASTDGTEQLVKKFNDDRIKYTKLTPEKSCADNWNNALSNSTGDYVIIIGDDDALVPGALSEINKHIETTPHAGMISWGAAMYYSPDYNEPCMRSAIELTGEFTGEVLRYMAHDVLNAYYGYYAVDNKYPPHISTVCTPRTVIRSILHRHGTFYELPLADITAIPRSLGYATFLHVIDKPLTVIGKTQKSATTRLTHDLQSWKEEYPFKPVHTIFKGNYSDNAYAESLLEVKFSEDRFAGYNIPDDVYYCRYYNDMLNASRSGADVSADMEIFIKTLDQQPDNLKAEVYKFMAYKNFTGLISQSFLWQTIWFRRFYWWLTGGKTRVVFGTDVGVNNIGECAGFIHKHWRNI